MVNRFMVAIVAAAGLTLGLAADVSAQGPGCGSGRCCHGGSQMSSGMQSSQMQMQQMQAYNQQMQMRAYYQQQQLAQMQAQRQRAMQQQQLQAQPTRSTLSTNPGNLSGTNTKR